MPGIGVPIIIGGGIALANPNAIGEFLKVSSITPPAANSSSRLRLSGTELIMESAAGRTNTVIGPGTSSTATVNEPEVLIGSSVTSARTSTGVANVGIGGNIGFTSSSDSNIIIGEMAAGIFPSGGATGIGNVHIGRVASLGGTSRNANVTVGDNITCIASQSVVIGNSASANGNDSVIIGDTATSSVGANIVIGQAASAAGTRTYIIGGGTSATGTSDTLILIGQAMGAFANIDNIIAIGHNQVSTGLVAGDVVLGHNQASNFSSRLILFGADTHTTGVAVPAATVRFKNALGTNIAAGDATLIAPRSTGNAAPASIVVQTGATGGSGTTLQTATTVARFVGAAAPHFEISVDRGLRFVSQTSSAGASAGTLNNAPAAGDPAFWLRLTINGTNHAIPAWLG